MINTALHIVNVWCLQNVAIYAIITATPMFGYVAFRKSFGIKGTVFGLPERKEETFIIGWHNTCS
jgi:hypothetical protein